MQKSIVAIYKFVLFSETMKKLLLIIYGLMVGLVVKAQDTTQHVTPKRVNSLEQQQKPYVILISVDAFRADFAELYQAKNLLALKEMGASANYMLSSFPSFTFPNHYTIATGLYPAHHGIVDNIFYDKERKTIYKKSDPKQALDSSWYGGKPLWVLAEQQKMLSAVYYWPGSEIAIDGVRPTYYYAYNELIPLEQRINSVKEWLALPLAQRPHLIALYFPQVDKAAHNYGPDSEQTANAVKLIDDAIGKLVSIAKESGLPINFIFVSDHGMAKIDNENTLQLPKAINNLHYLEPPGNALLQVYAKDEVDIKATYRELKKDTNFSVYLHDRIPKRYHFGGKYDRYNRVGDLILTPKLPKIFSINGIKPSIGQHGFDPSEETMRATFYSWGPNIKNNFKVKPFENIHVYPLVTEILGLSYQDKIDGKKSVLRSILK